MRTFAGSVVRLASIAEPGRPRPGHSSTHHFHQMKKVETMTNKHQGIKRLALLACIASALVAGRRQPTNSRSAWKSR
jgi:hypothetical protein